ncbi:MAG: signal peptidase II [Candidatus Izemoplasmatales bacterium]|jgi:signal peptidase II|nr:signal peptidase II [Candidatus Izemoplasmatales bacterium]
MLVWIIIAALLLVLDQLTKALIVTTLVTEGSTLPIIQDFFHFTYVRNAGAVFGIGGDAGWLYYFFIGAAIIASIIFVILFIKIDHKNPKLWLYSLSLALLFAGTLGNCCDRLFQYDHQVIDFIDFRGIWPYIFNVADMCLTVGIGCFLFDQLLLEPRRVKNNDKTGV